MEATLRRCQGTMKANKWWHRSPNIWMGSYCLNCIMILVFFILWSGTNVRVCLLDTSVHQALITLSHWLVRDTCWTICKSDSSLLGNTLCAPLTVLQDCLICAHSLHKAKNTKGTNRFPPFLFIHKTEWVWDTQRSLGSLVCIIRKGFPCLTYFMFLPKSKSPIFF